jgi:aerobic-type carbon monoxide dehydrogenase small subunit (CoxS/CutS family)
MKIEFVLNGEAVSRETDPTRRLLDLLREDFHLTAAKESCGEGECGACTILVDGRAVLSCLMLAGQVAGRSVDTLEGLMGSGKLDLLAAAFGEKSAVQCGFCTPGFLVAAYDYLRRGGGADPDEIRLGLDGNICRCTGYSQIVEAVAAAARKTDRPERTDE